MARKKLARSADLDRAKTRASALKSIDANLDLGNSVSVMEFDKIINETLLTLDKYNSLLSQIDKLYNDFQEQNLVVKDLSERLLAGVGSKYGKNSNEYEMAGGKKKSERKKPARKTV